MKNKELDRAVNRAYIIVFEINKELDRSPLIFKLKEFQRYFEVTSSCWIVITGMDADSVMMNIREVTYPGEHIFVAEIVRTASRISGFLPDVAAWIEEELH